MKCSRCKKWIEGNEIKFAEEGDWMGKPLCSKCKAEVEEEARNKYRRGRAKEYLGNLYRSMTYRNQSNRTRWI